MIDNPLRGIIERRLSLLPGMSEDSLRLLGARVLDAYERNLHFWSLLRIAASAWRLGRRSGFLSSQRAGVKLALSSRLQRIPDNARQAHGLQIDDFGVACRGPRRSWLMRLEGE